MHRPGTELATSRSRVRRPTATLTKQPDIEVITKLYFVIIAAFKESTTLNFAQRYINSTSYILAAIESPCIFIPAVYSKFSSILNRFGDIDGVIRPEPTV